MLLSKLLSRVDILGIAVQFQVKGDDKFKTILGGSLTLLLGIITAVSIWGFGRDIIEKANPNFISRQDQLASTPLTTVNSTNFFHAIRIADDVGGLVNDKRIFDLKFEYYYSGRNFSTNSDEKIETSEIQTLSFCNTSHIDNETLVREELFTYYCANTHNKLLGGSWSEDYIGVLTYKVQRCNNETEQTYNITCKTDQEIMNEYNGVFYVEAKFSRFLINPSDVKNPITMIYEYQSQVIDIQLRKVKNIFYTTSQLLTDEGLVMKEFSTKSFIDLDKTELDFGKIKSDYNVYFTDIMLTKKKVEFERSYIKFQSVAATVGGFFGLSLSALNFVSNLFSENSFRHFLYDKLLDLKTESEGHCDDEINHSDISISPIDRKETKNPTKKKEDVDLKVFYNTNYELKEERKANNSSGFQKLDKPQENSNKVTIVAYKSQSTSLPDNKQDVGEVNNPNDNLNLIGRSKTLVSNDRLTSIKDYINKNRKKVEVSVTSLFLFRNCSCFYTKNRLVRSNDTIRQILYLAEHEINEKLDVLNLMKSIDQIEIFKKVILNENQCYMLENVGRKLVTNIKDFNRDYTEVVNERNSIKEEQLLKYIQEKKEMDSFSNTDNLLLEFINEDLKTKLS